MVQGARLQKLVEQAEALVTQSQDKGIFTDTTPATGMIKMRSVRNQVRTAVLSMGKRLEQIKLTRSNEFFAQAIAKEAESVFDATYDAIFNSNLKSDKIQLSLHFPEVRAAARKSFVQGARTMATVVMAPSEMNLLTGAQREALALAAKCEATCAAMKPTIEKSGNAAAVIDLKRLYGQLQMNAAGIRGRIAEEQRGARVAWREDAQRSVPSLVQEYTEDYAVVATFLLDRIGIEARAALAQAAKVAYDDTTTVKTRTTGLPKFKAARKSKRRAA